MKSSTAYLASLKNCRLTYSIDRRRQNRTQVEVATENSIRWMLVMVLLLSGGYCASATEVSLSPLEEIVWSLQGRIDDTSEIPLAVALSAQGKRIDIDYTDVTVTVAPVYSGPLEACVAVIRACVEMDESWWGDLCAQWIDRDVDGAPLASYTPDSGANMYDAFTYHTVDSDFPRTTGATIKTYLRIGGLHAFDIAWTQVAGGVTSTGIRFVLAFQEGPSGKYRFAPEWMSPFDPLKDVLANSEPESTLLADYRTAIPSRSHSFAVYGLYNGAPDTFPLTCYFRGGLPETSPFIGALGAFRTAYSAAAKAVPATPEDFPDSGARSDLADLLTGDGLQALDEQDHVGRVFNPFRRPFAFVIESPDYVIAFNKDDDTGMVNPGFVALYQDGTALKWTGFHISTMLDEFLTHDLIWPKLNEVIESALLPE